MIFNLFKISIINFIKTKAILAKEFHIQPAELDNMPVWEYELFVKEINNAVKEENDRNKQEMENAGISDAKKMASPSYLNKMQKNSIPKLPNISMPKISMPKL